MSTLLVLLVAGQITKPPEFSDAVQVQSAQTGALESSSHVSAERAEIHAGVLRQLGSIPEYAGGLKLIEQRLNGPAGEWFQKQKLEVGVAAVLFLNGREPESAALLCDLAGRAPESPALIEVMGETVGVAKDWAPKLLAAMRKLARAGDARSEYALGLALLRQEPAVVEEGLGRLRSAARLDAKDTLALLEIARQQTQLGDRVAAAQALEAVVERDEKSAAAHYRLSQLYRALGQGAKAATHMARFKELTAPVK